jgi:hypothetical protein
MHEYVYTLNLPTIDEILLPGKYQELFIPSSSDIKLSFVNPQQCLLESHRTFKHFKWDVGLLFYKANGKEGIIHSDSQPDSPTASWAINYVLGGTGTLKYYDYSQLPAPKMIPDNLGNNRPVYENPTVAPVKTYTMPPGVYLVRTDTPHIASGHGQRYCLSVRSQSHQNEQWETIVNEFTHYIV